MARPKMHTEAVGDRLVDEAMRIVADRGIAALSVRETASAAGTSTSAVYSLFGSKDGLARSVLVRAFESFAQAQVSATQSGEASTDLAGMGVMYVAWALENPRLYELMFGQSVVGIAESPETRAASAQAIAPLKDGVRRAIDAGIFRPAEVDTVVASLWSQVHGLSTLMLAGRFPEGADPGASAMAIIDGWRAVRP